MAQSLRRRPGKASLRAATKTLALVTAGALLLGGATPVHPAPRATERVSQSLVDFFDDARRAFGQDAWGGPSLEYLLRKLHSQGLGAGSFDAAVQQALAATELRSGQYSSAYDHARQAAALHRAIGLPRAYIGDILTRAQAEYRLGVYELALADLVHAQDLIGRTKDGAARPVRGLVHMMRGEVERALGDHAAARTEFQAAARFQSPVLLYTARANDYLDAGEAARSRARYLLAPDEQLQAADLDFQRAAEQFTRAITAYRTAVRHTATSLCGADRSVGKLACSDAYFYQDILGQGWTDPRYLLALAQLGNARALSALGDDDRASRALSAAKEIIGRFVGVVDPASTNPIESLQFLIDARSAMQKGSAARDELLTHTPFISAELTQSKVPGEMWRTYYDIAGAYAALGQRDQALRYYSYAINELTSLQNLLSPSRREGFLEQQLPVYDDYIEYLLRSPTAENQQRAWYALQARSTRETIDAIARTLLERFSRTGSPQVRRAIAVYRRIESAAEQLPLFSDTMSGAPAQAAAAEIKFNIGEDASGLRTLLGRIARSENSGDRRFAQFLQFYLSPAAQSIGAQQQLLRPHETMLLYAWLPHEIALWTISKKGSALHVIPRKPNELESYLHSAFIDQINLIRAGVRPEEARQPNYLGTFAFFSRRVYDALVAPAHVAPSDALVIIPSGPLYNVAWEALATGQNMKHCPGAYLICAHAISYAASPQQFALARNASASNAVRTLLAFANPVFAGGTSQLAQLPPLKYSGIDAIDSARPFQQTLPRPDIRSGARASHQALMALNATGALSQYRYVLFDTHALLPGEAGVSQPAIVLSHPDRRLSLLTTADIFNLRINARVVMLAACSTGAYQDPADRPLGDGISAMTRAFLAAGAHSVGVTLWPVYDPAGPHFVPPFFVNLKAGATPAEALRQAKIAMINGPMRHPFFWAPAVLYGDADQ